MRKRALACALCVAGALWLVPSASADTATIGAAAQPTDGFFGGCADPCDFMQETTDPASPSYVIPPVPAGQGQWTITSWSALGDTGDGSAALEVWRPTGAQNEYRLVSIGDQLPFPANVLTSHAVSVPVLPGDHLGVRAGDSDFRPIYSSPRAGDAWLNPHELPAVGETAGGSSSDHNPVGRGANGRVNVQAVVTSAPPAATPGAKTKCKTRKKHKRSAASSKKKKCKKHKKK